VGKYFGELPFTIELNALVDDDFFHKELIIGEAEADKLDSTQNKIWAGLHLQEMEKMPEQNNALIKNIIENSMTANVLSLYTAFLCLEDTSQYCYDCIDETELVDVPHTHMDTLFLISPNPFRDVVNIRISGLNEVKAEDLTLQIFSARGELIKNFDPKQLKTEDEMLLTWDARETSNGPGMYFFLCRSEGQLYTRKLIRIRE
jgi:hypothetical protein